MSERDLTFRGLLIESYMADGLTRADAEEIVDLALPAPPDESTFEGWLRARYLEIQSDLILYGQHPPPPPEERAQPRGIGPDFVWVDEVIDLPPSALSIATPDEGEVDAILHDPLWSLDRGIVPEA